MEFWLSGSLSNELFLFSRWDSGYQDAFHTNSSFFTMEFWLSGSLSHELFLFSRWNSGYQEAFHMNFFFFHDGILAIRKPFTRIFSFFTMELWLSESLFTNFSFTWWNLGYHGAFSRIFLSHGGISAITEPFHEFFFHMTESRLSRNLFTIFFTWWNLGYHGAFFTNFSFT
jgi:hypothetical protein